MKTTIEHKGVELQGTTFEGAVVGERYVTPAGFEVEVMEHVPGSHAILRTAKGKELRTKLDAGCYGPLPVQEAAGGAQADEDLPGDAGADALVAEAQGTPAPKAPRARDPRLPTPGTPIVRAYRSHQVVVVERDDGAFVVGVDGEPIGTVKSLTAAAEIVLAREGITSGVNGFRWFGVGTEAPAPRPRAAAPDVQVLSLGLPRETVCLLDAAVQASGAGSRSAFIREAIVAHLRGLDLTEAADAIAAT